MHELKVIRERRAGYAPAGARLTSPAAVNAAFRAHFAPLDREQFVIALLDSKNRALGFHVVSTGTLNASLVHPREVFKVAILANAAAIILMHNHPSGEATPSAEDMAITERLVNAGAILGIAVLDHLVFGDEGFVAFSEANLMP